MKLDTIKNYISEDKKQEFSNLNECIFSNSLLAINICDEGYQLENGMCKKEEEVAALENNVCPEGYTYDGTNCVSNINYDKIIDQQCLLPNDGAYEVYISSDGECVANYCSNWSDTVECTAGQGQPIDFTITEYCPNGTTMISGVCKSLSASTLEYSCDEGTLNGNKCIITLEEESHMGCMEGYTYNKECNLCVLGE